MSDHAAQDQVMNSLAHRLVLAHITDNGDAVMAALEEILGAVAECDRCLVEVLHALACAADTAFRQEACSTDAAAAIVAQWIAYNLDTAEQD